MTDPLRSAPLCGLGNPHLRLHTLPGDATYRFFSRIGLYLGLFVVVKGTRPHPARIVPESQFLT